MKSDSGTVNSIDRKFGNCPRISCTYWWIIDSATTAARQRSVSGSKYCSAKIRPNARPPHYQFALLLMAVVNLASDLLAVDASHNIAWESSLHVCFVCQPYSQNGANKDTHNYTVNITGRFVQKLKRWWLWLDLNQRPTHYECAPSFVIYCLCEVNPGARCCKCLTMHNDA